MAIKRLRRSGLREPDDPRRRGRLVHGRAVQGKIKEYKAEWYRVNKAKLSRQSRERHLRAAYGITGTDYQRMLDGQNNRCAICGGDSAGRRLHVDHCHATGSVRGLLCSACNTSLAVVEDEEFLRLARAYLGKGSL